MLTPPPPPANLGSPPNEDDVLLEPNPPPWSMADVECVLPMVKEEWEKAPLPPNWDAIQ